MVRCKITLINDKNLRALATDKLQKLGVRSAFALAFFIGQAAHSNSVIDTAEYDWVPASQLTEQERNALPVGCEGKYQDPLHNISQSNSNTEPSELVIEANHSIVEQGKMATLQGDVKISQDTKEIRADSMAYNQEDDEGELDGNVTVRQPGLLIRADKATINASSNESTLTNTRFVLHKNHMRGSAEKIEQTPDNIIVLTNGALTSCEPGANTWSIEGKQLKLNITEGKGSGKNITLKVASVPVIYLPYIEFPLGEERKTGLLFPSLSSSDDGGLDIALPYYFNLAPNYDATLTPRFISGRGLMLEGETRHLNQFLSSQFNFGYLPNDKGGQDSDADRLIAEGEDEAILKPYKNKDRWLGSFKQTGGSRDSWYSSISYTKVSDRNYFRDLDTSSLSLANLTHLGQYAELGHYSQNWLISGRIENQQVLLQDLNDPYRKLPQIDVLGQYDEIGFEYQLKHQYTHFTHKNNNWLNGHPIIKGHRLNTDYRVGWPKSNEWGFFKPEVGVKTLSYLLESEALEEGQENTIQLATPQLSLDSGIVFEHSGGHFLQTIEPRLFYLYRNYTDHSDLIGVNSHNQNVNFDTSERTFTFDQLYRDSRYTGGDRLDDANQLSFGVTSHWYKNKSGAELLSLGLGQTTHFDDRKVGIDSSSNTNDYSEIAGEANIHLGALSQVYMSALYDTGPDEFSRSTAGLHYASKDYKYIFNVAYSYVKDYSESEGKPGEDIDQLDFSAVAPLSKQWQLTGRYNYDFTNKQELETFVGLEYNDCCYRIRVLARRWLDSNIASLDSISSDEAKYDQGLFFEIQFKGLGGSGAKVNSILNDSIFGYEEREHHLTNATDSH